MNIHSRLIGALDGVILGLAACLMFALLFELFRPPMVELSASAAVRESPPAATGHRAARSLRF